MQERRLNIKMSQEEFDAFKIALVQGEEQLANYIHQYITTYSEKQLFPDDVLSLALIQAIKKKVPDLNLIIKILSTQHEGNILATADDNKLSAILLILCLHHTQEIMDMIEEYLKGKEEYLHSQGKEIPKVDLTGETLISIRSAMHRAIDYMTVFDAVPYVRDHFLQYIYTASTLDQFESTFVKDFSPHEYRAMGHEAFFQQWHQASTNAQEETKEEASTRSASTDSSTITPASEEHTEEQEKKRPKWTDRPRSNGQDIGR